MQGPWRLAISLPGSAIFVTLPGMAVNIALPGKSDLVSTCQIHSKHLPDTNCMVQVLIVRMILMPVYHAAAVCNRVMLLESRQSQQTVSADNIRLAGAVSALGIT